MRATAAASAAISRDLLPHAIQIVDQVFGVGVLGSGRFGFAIRHDRPVVDAVRQLPQPVGQAADDLAQAAGIDVAHVDQPFDAVRAQLSGGDRPDAPQRVDRQLLQERFDALRADDRQAVRLLPAGGDLRQKLVRRDAGRRRQAGVVANALFSRRATAVASVSPQAFSVTSR